MVTACLCGGPHDRAQVLVAGRVIAITRCLQPSAPVTTMLKVTLVLVKPQKVTERFSVRSKNCPMGMTWPGLMGLPGGLQLSYGFIDLTIPSPASSPHILLIHKLFWAQITFEPPT